jgi:hypothetical protein
VLPDDAPYTLGMRVFTEVEADVTDIWNTITPFNKVPPFATLFRR